jgi:hypothetical protein
MVMIVTVSLTIGVLLSCIGGLKCIATSRIDLYLIEDEITYKYGDTISLNIDIINPDDSNTIMPINEHCFWLSRYDSESSNNRDIVERLRYYNISSKGSDSTVVLKPGEMKRMVLHFIEDMQESNHNRKMTTATYELSYACMQFCDGGYIRYLGDCEKQLRINTLY